MPIAKFNTHIISDVMLTRIIHNAVNYGINQSTWVYMSMEPKEAVFERAQRNARKTITREEKRGCI